MPPAPRLAVSHILLWVLLFLQNLLQRLLLFLDTLSEPLVLEDYANTGSSSAEAEKAQAFSSSESLPSHFPVPKA